MRATTSVWPPGGNVTITRMGLVGHACACTPAAKPPTAEAPAAKPMAARTARRITERILPARLGACAPAAYCAIATHALSMGRDFARLRPRAAGGGVHGSLLRSDQVPPRQVLRGGQQA